MKTLCLDGHTAIYLLRLMAKATKDQLFSPSHFIKNEEEFLAQLPHDAERIISEFNEYEISFSVQEDELLTIMLLYSDIFDIDEANCPVGINLHIAASKLITKED